MSKLTEKVKNKIRHDVDLYVQGIYSTAPYGHIKTPLGFVRLKYVAYGIDATLDVARERLRELKILGYGNAHEFI